MKLINSIKPRRHVGETVAVCKRAAANRVYPKIPACEIGEGAVGCCRISEVDEGAKGRSGKEEKVVEREAVAEEEEKDPNIRVPSYKQGG